MKRITNNQLIFNEDGELEINARYSAKLLTSMGFGKFAQFENKYFSGERTGSKETARQKRISAVKHERKMYNQNQLEQILKEERKVEKENEIIGNYVYDYDGCNLTEEEMVSYLRWAEETK